jgi:hypothetical protein
VDVIVCVGECFVAPQWKNSNNKKKNSHGDRKPKTRIKVEGREKKPEAND